MKTLIVEDDFTSRAFLSAILNDLGSVDIAVNGKESIEAVQASLSSGEHYDLILLDIMMPEMNGQEALMHLREAEESAGIIIGKGAKVIMTTALSDKDNIMEAFRHQADGYLVKPIDKGKLLEKLRDMSLLE
jgi:two-component system, chemotaxis family, chemotaxis protein CheY